MKTQNLSAIAAVGTLVFATVIPAVADVPYALLHSFFDPETNSWCGSSWCGTENGYRVAIDGNIAVVAAGMAGTVKVYNASTGEFLHLLEIWHPTDPLEVSYPFGSFYPVPYPIGYPSVAISGTRIVVSSQTSPPRVPVFDITSATPRFPVLTLTNPAPSTNDGFGRAVAISDTRVLVGVPSDDTGAENAGRAYVYDLASPTPGVPVTTLNNPSPSVGDSFGYSVVISGTRVVVGAHRDETGRTNAGRVYVYDLASPAPTVPLITLTNPTPASAYFGGAIAVSGTLVAVGYTSDYGYSKMEDLYAALGYGKYSARQVLQKIAPGQVKDERGGDQKGGAEACAHGASVDGIAFPDSALGRFRA